ncbi:MAG: hypothetical protein LBH49_02400 [Puniceicoccales bacterium]|nr:hypothetical protein [Puniceicoccales bacterium]
MDGRSLVLIGMVMGLSLSSYALANKYLHNAKNGHTSENNQPAYEDDDEEALAESKTKVNPKARKSSVKSVANASKEDNDEEALVKSKTKVNPKARKSSVKSVANASKEDDDKTLVKSKTKVNPKARKSCVKSRKYILPKKKIDINEKKIDINEQLSFYISKKKSVGIVNPGPPKYIFEKVYLSIQEQKVDAAMVFCCFKTDGGINDNFKIDSIHIILKNGDVFISCNKRKSTEILDKKSLDQLIDKNTKCSTFLMVIVNNAAVNFIKLNGEDGQDRNIMAMLSYILRKNRYYKFTLNISDSKRSDHKNITTRSYDLLQGQPTKLNSQSSSGKIIWEKVKCLSLGSYCLCKEVIKKTYPIIAGGIGICVKGLLLQITKPNGPIFSIAGSMGDKILSGLENMDNSIGSFAADNIRGSKLGRELFSMITTGLFGEFTNKYLDNYSDNQIKSGLNDQGIVNKMVHSTAGLFRNGLDISTMSITEPKFIEFICDVTNIALSAIVGDNSTDRFLDKDNPEYHKSWFAIGKQNFAKKLGMLPGVGGFLKNAFEDKEMSLKEARQEEVARREDYKRAKDCLDRYIKRKKTQEDDPTLKTLKLAMEVAELRSMRAGYKTQIIDFKIDSQSYQDETKKNNIEKSLKDTESNIYDKKAEIIKIMQQNKLKILDNLRKKYENNNI